MGTHPIFESDFDCLTDLTCRAYIKCPTMSPMLSILSSVVILMGIIQMVCHVCHGRVAVADSTTARKRRSRQHHHRHHHHRCQLQFTGLLVRVLMALEAVHTSTRMSVSNKRAC